MASNFHDMNGLLVVGLDFHWGLQVGFIPQPFWEVNVAHPFWAGSDPNDKVLINGTQSVKDQHEPLLLWPHFPITPFNIIFPLDVLLGSQKCWLPKLTVQAQGKPMTTAMIGPISTNLDCHTPAKLPSSFILQTGTVETTPNLQDVVWGVGRAAVSAAIDYFFSVRGGGDPPSVIDVTIGRFLPVGGDRVDWERWAISTLGGSPQGVVAAFLDALNVGTGVQGQSWQSLVGQPTNVLDPIGGQGPSLATAGRQILQNLFPPLKLFPVETVTAGEAP